jgi:hypothetical protein
MKAKKLKIIIYIIIVSFYFFACERNTKTYPLIIGLNEFSLPEASSVMWEELSHSFQKRYYINKYGKVKINPNNNFIQTLKGKFNKLQKSMKLPNGAIFGTDKDEWGGELIFVNDSVEYKILEYENIRGIIEFNNEIYILTGLAHLSSYRGKIIKLGINNDKWEYKSSIELDSPPEMYAIVDKKLYIVTYHGLFVFDGNNIQQLLNKQYWYGLYPNSIYANDKIIGIGMSCCIAIINKKNNNVKWYK